MTDAQLPTVPLPPIKDGAIGGAIAKTVNGRDVHAYLAVKRDYSSYMKDRIARFGFVEGVDFVIYEDLISPVSGSSKARDRATVEYALSLDMAKQLGMIDRSDRGREIRRYFLDCERHALAGPVTPAIPDFNDPVVLQAYLLEQTKGRIEDQRRAAEAESTALALQSQLDRLRSVKGAMSLRDAGKTLGLSKCDDIFKELHLRKWIYRRGGKGEWVAHAEPYHRRYLDHRTVTFRGKGGEDEVKSQVVVTPAGLVKIAEMLAKPVTH